MHPWPAIIARVTATAAVPIVTSVLAFGHETARLAHAR